MLGRARTGDGGRVAGDLVMVFGPQRDLARARVPAIVAMTLECSVQARVTSFYIPAYFSSTDCARSES